MTDTNTHIRFDKDEYTISTFMYSAKSPGKRNKETVLNSSEVVRAVAELIAATGQTFKLEINDYEGKHIILFTELGVVA